jgi:hypothetical protein
MGVGGGQPHALCASTPGKDPESFVQEAGWAPGPVSVGGRSRPNRDSIPDRPGRSQSLYRLSYQAHNVLKLFYLKFVVFGGVASCGMKTISI